MLKYLVKFVSKQEYAQMLLQGDLFMRPASYYQCLEQGQGDCREGAISHHAMIFMNAQYPIYCLYSVDESDIENGCIKVPSRCIEDFHCQNGYAVIIDYELFETVLPTLYTTGYQMSGGRVQYHVIRDDEFGTLASNKNALNLFVKHPYYAYQKEYRLVVFELLTRKQDHKVYSFNRSIQNFADIVSISSVDFADGDYLIPVCRT